MTLAAWPIPVKDGIMLAVWCAINVVIGFSTPGVTRHVAAFRETVVFRHHPGIIQPQEQMAACVQDEEVIFKALKNNHVSYCYKGGFGHDGFMLSIRREDLARWKAMIDVLHKAGRLSYYTKWGLNQYGFGLVPISAMEYDAFVMNARHQAIP